MRRVAIVVLLVALVGLAGGGWYAYLAVKAKMVYHPRFVCNIRFESTTLPAKDKDFEDWLRSQPEVEKASVRRDYKEVVIDYQTAGDDLLPAIRDQCTALGYQGTDNMAVYSEYYGDGERPPQR